MIPRLRVLAVVLQVKDTGEGIAPQDLPHIWERFYQAESPLSLRGNGMGLGFALVKEWIEAMDGTGYRRECKR